jgi:CubicO group peptidase (beta-lactamase class C family)
MHVLKADKVWLMSKIEGLSGIVVTDDGSRVNQWTGGRCTPQTRFQIASVSKNFAASLTMLLVADGLLDLHEPVGKWLPEAPSSWRSMSLHHLLSNSSGIGHWKEIPGTDPAVPAGRDDRLEAILRAPLRFEPGTQFHYSSPAFIVVGVVAERAAGAAYPQLLSDRILRPLGLTRTVSGSRPDDVIQGHHDGEPIPSWDLTSVIGSGDMCSTAEDLMTYAQALGSGAVVSADSLALMRTRHIAFAEPDRSPDGRLDVTGYGYGHYVGTFDGRPAVLHTGDNPGYRSLVGWLGESMHIVALSNDDAILWEDVLARVL